jgi:predicted amino acid racemase
VTVLRQCCDSVVTVLRQCCDSVVTALRQCCDSVVANVLNIPHGYLEQSIMYMYIRGSPVSAVG